MHTVMAQCLASDHHTIIRTPRLGGITRAG